MNGHLSLFSGIGGLDLAAEWAGFRTVAFVERDKYCQRVLARHWPGVPIFDDVCEVVSDSTRDLRGASGHDFGNAFNGAGPIGLISGGFPCQPHSVAGKRQASRDERDLWDECARITGEFRPRWAVFENVPGLLSSEGGTFFARVLGDLAALGYRVGWGVWGANDVGAVHKRDRVFIVANLADAGIGRLRGARRREMEQQRGAEAIGASEDVAHAGCDGWEPERVAGIGSGTQSSREGNGKQRERIRAEPTDGREDVADASGSRPSGQRKPIEPCDTEAAGAWEATRPVDGCVSHIWSVEPQVGRVANGIPRRVDRLRALGNAVVPQQAYPIFKAIADIEGIA